jgi:hypothetical protein
MMLHSLPIGGARCRKDRYDPRMVGRTVRDLPMCSPGARRPRLRRSRAGVRRRPGRCGNRLYPISPNHRHSCLPWRVAVLYLAGEVFACRKCYGLAYASQQGGLLFRNLRKSQGIRMRLGGSPDPFAPFPAKPRRMHRRTYRRLRAQARDGEALTFGRR